MVSGLLLLFTFFILVLTIVYAVSTSKETEKTAPSKAAATSPPPEPPTEEEPTSAPVPEPPTGEGPAAAPAPAPAPPTDEEPAPVPAEPTPPACEITGDWVPGVCESTGTFTSTRAYTGPCALSDVQKTELCCYEKGDWVDITTCSQTGTKTQRQTTINCDDATKLREVECPYIGPWFLSGSCSVDGLQKYTRDVVNSESTFVKTEPCCYEQGDWTDLSACEENGTKLQQQSTANCDDSVKTRRVECEYAGAWQAVGSCTTSGTQQYQRDVTVDGITATMTKTEPCCYQKGDWTDAEQECSSEGKMRQTQTTKNCDASVATRYIDCEYIGPWEPSPCTESGTRLATRKVVNSTAKTSDYLGCCYTSPWVEEWDSCYNGVKTGKKTRTITSACPWTYKTELTIPSQSCKNCDGNWEFTEYSYGECKCSDGRYSCYQPKYEHQTYTRTQEAENGGLDNCPATGDTRKNFLRSYAC